MHDMTDADLLAAWEKWRHAYGWGSNVPLQAEPETLRLFARNLRTTYHEEESVLRGLREAIAEVEEEDYNHDRTDIRQC